MYSGAGYGGIYNDYGEKIWFNYLQNEKDVVNLQP
jgi:hypothetical protein